MTHSVRITLGTALTLLVQSCSVAVADDQALYGEAAPADAAFIRVLGNTPGRPIIIPFGGATLELDQSGTEAYAAVSTSELTEIESGAFYSVAIDHSGAHRVIPEPKRDQASKVHLILVNTQDDPVRLVVPNQNIEVIAPVNPGASASRAVNPVNTELAVERVHDNAILSTFDVRLSRGQNLTFVTTPNAARVIENSFGPVVETN